MFESSNSPRCSRHHNPRHPPLGPGSRSGPRERERARAREREGKRHKERKSERDRERDRERETERKRARDRKRKRARDRKKEGERQKERARARAKDGHLDLLGLGLLEEDGEVDELRVALDERLELVLLKTRVWGLGLRVEG